MAGNTNVKRGRTYTTKSKSFDPGGEKVYVNSIVHIAGDRWARVTLSCGRKVTIHTEELA